MPTRRELARKGFHIPGGCKVIGEPVWDTPSDDGQIHGQVLYRTRGGSLRIASNHPIFSVASYPLWPLEHTSHERAVFYEGHAVPESERWDRGRGSKK
jgi:hypothetical protein